MKKSSTSLGAVHADMAGGGPRLPKKSELIAQSLVTTIMSQGLVPGDRLPGESELMTMLGVGRGSLREALRILELNGLVSIKTGPSGGAVIREPSAQTLGKMATLYFQVMKATYADLINARMMFEIASAVSAAEHPRPEAVAVLRDIQKRATPDVVRVDANHLQLSREFHLALADITGNPIVGLLTRSLAELLIVRIKMTVDNPEDREQVWKEHGEIVEAIAAGDLARVRVLMSEHMDGYYQTFVHQVPGLLNETVSWE